MPCLAVAYRPKPSGIQRGASSNASKAQEYLEKCVAAGVANFVEYQAAQVEMVRLKDNR